MRLDLREQRWRACTDLAHTVLPTPELLNDPSYHSGAIFRVFPDRRFRGKDESVGAVC